MTLDEYATCSAVAIVGALKTIRRCLTDVGLSMS